MTERFYSDLFFILLATIVAAILGYLIGRLTKSKKQKALKTSLDACHKNKEDLKKEVDTLVNKKGETNSFSSSYTKPKVSVASTVTPADRIKTSFDASAAKLAIGKTIKHNDLKIVEGIGPKIEELINNDGITTWEQLSKAPESRLTKILKEGGDRFLFHVPGTWPRQAGLAFEGKWKDLKELQDRLDGGKEIIK